MGKPAATDRRRLKSLSHSFTLDGVVHCRTEREAQQLLEALRARFQECQLVLHPEKTQIIYCKDDDRRHQYPKTQFDFLGYTFRPRRAKNRYGKFFVTFTPGVSNKAAKAMRQTILAFPISEFGLYSCGFLVHPL
jgi:hypothetical protein